MTGFKTMRSFYIPGGIADAYLPCDVYPHGMVRTVFDDGAVSVFIPPDKEDFRDAALEFGYGDDFVNFGLEHDMLHHWVARCLSWPCSPVIWKAAHGRLPEWQPKHDVWPFHPDGWHEEHIVTRLQAFIRTGAVDEDHGILLDLWGNRGLVLVAAGFVNWLICADPDNVTLEPPLIDTMAIARDNVASDAKG